MKFSSLTKVDSGNKKRGFTLIELLVVIAIIGILSAVVLASLNTARNKGADAAIKGDLAGVRASAEVLYDTLGNNYNDTGAAINSAACGAIAVVSPATHIANDTGIQTAIDHAITSNGGTEATCNITATGDAYAIAAPLKSTNVVSGSSGTDYWCVDSTGQSKAIDTIPASGDTAC